MKLLSAVALSISLVAFAAPAQVRPEAAPADAAWLGVFLADADTVVIDEVVPGSPAAQAGLRAGEIVLSINETPVVDADAFISLLNGRKAGDRIALEVRRGDETRELRVVLARRPDAVVRPVPKPQPAGGGRGTPPAAPQAEKSADVNRDGVLDAAQARAVRRGLPLVVFFHADWCANSKAMRASADHEAVRSVLSRFEALWLDAVEQDELADRFGVHALPHLVVIDGAGKRVLEHSGFLPPSELSAKLSAVPAVKAKSAVPPAAAARPVGAGKIESLQREVRELKRDMERMRAELRQLRAEVQRLRRR